MAFKQTIKHWYQKGVITGLVLATSLLVWPVSVLASTYGSGSYGDCKYSQGCTSTGAPKKAASTVPTTPTSDQATTVLLNDFPDFFSDIGKTLDLGQSQIVKFNITVNGQTETYTITVKQVGDGFVILSLAPNSFDVTLVLGQTGQYDVNSDGQNDIIITLNSIADGKANLTFKVAPHASVPKSTDNTTTTTPAAVSRSKSHAWLWIIISLAILLIALLIFFILWRRRRHDNDDSGQIWPPDQTNQPPPQTSYRPPSASPPAPPASVVQG